MDAFLGSIIIFGGNFAPRGWALCQGQLLPIAQNTALFSILGTTYGGNGQTTFALPDLRGRAPVGPGQGAGLNDVSLGEVGGNSSVALTAANLPAHTHSLNATQSAGDTRDPNGSVLAQEAAGVTASYKAATATLNATLAPNSVGATGGGQPIDVHSPYLGINYIIALQGIFPSRN